MHPNPAPGVEDSSLRRRGLGGKLPSLSFFGGDGKTLCWDTSYYYNDPTTSSVKIMILKIKEKEFPHKQERQGQRETYTSDIWR